jgi:type IV pilus assembly protein PilC
MPYYAFRIATPQGSVRNLEVEGETLEAARRSLESQGYLVFSGSDRHRQAPVWRLPAWGRTRIGPRALLVFNQELLALVKAGLPILTALDLLRQRGQQPQLRALLDTIREAVRGGASLSTALGHHPTVFPLLYTSALQAGEQSGNFVDALSRYVEYQKRILSIRQRMQGAITYPAILVGLSLAVVLFLLTYVVPTFIGLYGDMEAQLPAATRLLIAVTGQLKFALPFAGLALLAGQLALWRWRRTPAGRRITDRWLLLFPWTGGLITGYLFSRFARTLAMMQAGGIPMIPSLEATFGTMQNAYLESRIRTALPRVAAGSSLADALERTEVVPPLLVELVAVGETSGALVDMLGHTAELLETEMDTRLTTLIAVIEPAIMVGMGAMVATIVVIMYLPIFHLAAVVH